MAEEITLYPVCDGYVEHDSDPAYVAWATIIAAAGTDADEGEEEYAWAGFWSGLLPGADEWRQVMRGILIFDLSAYAGANLLTATLKLYGRSRGDTLSVLPTTNIYGADTASNDSLAAADYAGVLATPFSSDIAYTSWNYPDWNEFEFNEDGLDYLIGKLGSFAALSVRNSNYDVQEVAPSWVSNKYAEVGWAPTYYGESTRPQLILTYESPRRTVAVSDKITLETIRNIEMVAMGRFRVSKEGDAVYRSRYARNV